MTITKSEQKMLVVILNHWYTLCQQVRQDIEVYDLQNSDTFRGLLTKLVGRDMHINDGIKRKDFDEINQELKSKA